MKKNKKIIKKKNNKIDHWVAYFLAVVMLGINFGIYGIFSAVTYEIGDSTWPLLLILLGLIGNIMIWAYVYFEAGKKL